MFWLLLGLKDVISEVNDAVYLGEGPVALFSGFSKMVDDAIIGNNYYLKEAVYLLWFIVIHWSNLVRTSIIHTLLYRSITHMYEPL